MTEWTKKDFITLIHKNGYSLVKGRGKGGHSIYKNSTGNHISVPFRIKAVIARRLIKENNLNIHL